MSKPDYLLNRSVDMNCPHLFPIPAVIISHKLGPTEVLLYNSPIGTFWTPVGYDGIDRTVLFIKDWNLCGFAFSSFQRLPIVLGL